MQAITGGIFYHFLKLKKRFPVFRNKYQQESAAQVCKIITSCGKAVCSAAAAYCLFIPQGSGAHQPKADVVVPIRRSVVVPIR